MEKAALSLSAAVVSPILAKLGDKTASYFGDDITEEELQDLQSVVLPTLQTVAKAAPGVDALKPWLMALQGAAYEVEDVLDLYEYKRLEAEVRSLHDPLKEIKEKVASFAHLEAKEGYDPDPLKKLKDKKNLCRKSKLMKSLGMLRRSAVQAEKLVSLYGPISQIPSLRDSVKQVPTVSSPPSSSVFGREEERDLLVDMLISTTADVLAICGLGGAGKTTLAQYVYNDSRVVQHFDKRMWVHVSRKFDVERITTQIVESATEGEGSSTITNLDALQRRLKKEILKSKNFLLVLDDVWCQDSMQWEQMLAPLNESLNTGSRILVTTRTQEVARGLGIKNVVPLKDLEYEHCMSIFKHYSFGDANEVIHDQELATVANQIIEKLKKSPLSARMVGSILRRKKNVADWKQILKENKMLEDTLDVLYLSFDNLAPHLQRCFAYCSLYPKGYHFNPWMIDELLVSLWIAQGFVEASKDDKMTMENIGRQYFNELVSNSFFQKQTYDHDENDYYYMIHDLLHDLAEEVSKGHCFRIEDDSERIPQTVVHLSISSTKGLLLSHIKSDIFNLVNLRTFMIFRYESEVSYDSIFGWNSEIYEQFKKLRVLHLGKNRLLEFHNTIGQLKHIRYLQGEVEEVELLQKSLDGLYHLQFLNLGRDEVISKLPWCGKLVSLRRIEKYNVNRKKGRGIGQLKNLRHLGGSLRINNLENVQNKEEASEASLKEKMLLEELSLAWTYSPGRDGRIDEEVIKGLEPPLNLNVLMIDGYNGIENPKWLLNDGRFLRSLSELAIKHCPKLERVQSLPSTLKCLGVYRCAKLNEMPSLPLGLRVIKIEDCPNLMQLSPFPPNLEELDIRRCPGVETLLSNILVFEGEDEHPNNQQQHFPLKTLFVDSCSVSGKKRLFSDPNKLFTSLTTLELHRLPWLTSLFHPDHKLTSLKSINIEDCENLELFGSPLTSISPSLQLLEIRNCPRPTMPDMDGSLLLPCSLKRLIFDKCGDPEMNLLGRCLLGLTSLRTLNIRGYSDAWSLPDLANPGAIEHLEVSHCPELASMWNLQPFSSLTDLHIRNCPNLTSLPANMENLSSLRTLYIWGCPKIELLPNLPPSLKILEIRGCHPQFEANYKWNGPLRHQLRHTSLAYISTE